MSGISNSQAGRHYRWPLAGIFAAGKNGGRVHSSLARVVLNGNGSEAMHVPGLRSDREMVGGLVFFGRMLDKIRLHAQGRLPADYNRGRGFDGRVCRFLHVDYALLVAKAVEEKDDRTVLQWCYEVGRRPSEEELFVFNAFLSKRGWQDDVSDWVQENKAKLGLQHRDDIQTAFDIHDADEGRK
jgi:gluconokinase